MQMVRIAGSDERRPSATRIDSGNANTTLKVASITVSGNPPHRSVGTVGRPRPPPIRMKKAGITTSHSRPSHHFQNARMQLATSSPSSSTVAISGRHCCSKG